MDKIIKEEVSRISELMNIQTLNESVYRECERFSDNPSKMKVCKKIASLKSWIHKDDGLGLKKIINKKLEELKTDIPEDLREKYIDGAKLLRSADKINDREFEYFNNRMSNSQLVFLNGEWQPINKLNTNYSDLSELLTDLIYKGGDNSKPIIQSIIQDPKKGLTSLKKFLDRLLDKYFNDPNVLFDYTKNIIRASSYGESAEKRVKEVLEEQGFTTEYEGGNGDMVDMVFGTDLIVSHPKHGLKTVQVKSSENAWNRNEKYQYVDWVIIASPFTIYDNKTKKPVTI
jgi:hypothetical protein